MQTSRPVWGAWIEMHNVFSNDEHPKVAPRMGRVD